MPAWTVAESQMRQEFAFAVSDVLIKHEFISSGEKFSNFAVMRPNCINSMGLPERIAELFSCRKARETGAFGTESACCIRCSRRELTKISRIQRRLRLKLPCET